MTELVYELLPWFMGFYLLDAVSQLRRGQVAWAREWPFAFRRLGAGLQLTAVMPHGLLTFCYELPFLPSHDGLWILDARARADSRVLRPADLLECVPWSELKDLRTAGSVVRSGERVLFRARSPVAARWLVAELARLRDAPSQRRAEEWEHGLGRGFDGEVAQRRWARARLPLRILAALGWVQVGLLFGLMPLRALTPGLEQLEWSTLVWAVSGTHAAIVGVAAWSQRAAPPEARDVSQVVLPLLIFPPYAARACAHVVRELFVGLEPLTVASVLLPRPAFRRLAAREWVRNEAHAAATAQLGLGSFWRARRERMEVLLKSTGLTASDWRHGAPRVEDAAAVCPLCHCGYRERFTHCSDCGLALVPQRGSLTLTAR